MSFRDRVLAVGGRGQLRGKLLNLMPVMSGSGPEYDFGQLVTYVNDACMVAPIDAPHLRRDLDRCR